ncbi:unnamed protein product [Camellia sinensis]
MECKQMERECTSLSSIPRGKWYCKYCQNMFQREKFVEHNANAVAAGRVLGVDLIEQITKRCIRIVKNPEDAKVIACVLCRGYQFGKSGFGPHTVIVCDQGGNDASHSAEATAHRRSSSFARPDVDMHSRSGMATLSTIGVVASSMGLAVEKSSKVPDVTTALMDTKLGTEGRKDLFDWLSRQLSGLSCVVEGLNIFGWMCMDNKY